MSSQVLRTIFISLPENWCPARLGKRANTKLTIIHRPITAGSVPGSISGIKLTTLSNETFAMIFTGTAAPNGTLYNSELAEDPISTGRMYTSVFVRHWDTCESTYSKGSAIANT